MRNPEDFTGIDLAQYRLSLGDSDYNRLTKLQQALAEGKSDPAFERHRLGRLFLGEGLHNANVDPNGEEGRAARQRLDRLSGAFEAVEGKPPTMADIRGLVDDVLPRVNGDPNIVRTSGGEPVEAPLPEVEANGNTQIAQQQKPPEADQKVAPPTEPAPGSSEFTVKGAFDGAEPRIVHNDDGSAEVTAGKIPTPGGPAEATIRIDRDLSGASAQMVLPNGHRVESRRTSPDGRIWSQIDTIRDPQGTVVGTQTTTFDGTRVTQTWEPANGPAQTASWEAEPPSGDVHLANAGIGALGGLGTAGSLTADSLTATAKAIAGDMLALGTRALGLAGSAVAGVAAGAAVLLTPTNSQGTTVDLGDGVRLRQPPGDSSGVIEKSVLGGNMWDRTPVAVRIRDGGTSDRPQMLTIDATALERAIGPEAADRVLAEAATRFDVVPIYSSRPPAEKDRREETVRPQLDDPTAVSPRIPPPEEPDLKLERLAHWLIERRFRAERDKYVGVDGIDTAAGIKLDPRVGEPAAGRDYLPDDESHRKGLRGEYGLANDIARQFPDHTVIEFGRKAGERGPDVISVDRDGEIHFVDSKWRGSDTSIGPSRRAHQKEKSLKDALSHTEGSVLKAIDSGRLSPEATARALENLAKGNVTIVTVGTGSARNGVVERIVGGERAVVHPQRRP